MILVMIWNLTVAGSNADPVHWHTHMLPGFNELKRLFAGHARPNSDIKLMYMYWDRQN